MHYFLKRKMRKLVMSRKTDKLSKLIDEHPGCIDLDIGDCRDTALHLAAVNGYEEMVEMLLKKGAEVDRKNQYDWTPLHAAAYEGRLAVVVRLMNAGANANLLSVEGRTAFGWARARGATEVAEVLAPFTKKIAHLVDLQPQPKAIEAAPAAPAPVVKAGEWELMGDGQVAVTSLNAKLGYKMTDVFNFASRERIRIVNNLKTGADTMESTSFDRLPDRQQLQDAFNALQALGGHADPAVVESGSLKKSPRLPPPQQG
jgi:hypothetical protein